MACMNKEITMIDMQETGSTKHNNEQDKTWKKKEAHQYAAKRP